MIRINTVITDDHETILIFLNLNNIRLVNYKIIHQKTIIFNLYNVTKVYDT